MEEEIYSKPFKPQASLKTKYFLYILPIGISFWATFNIIIFLIQDKDTNIDISKDRLFAFYYSTGFMIVFFLITRWFITAYYNSMLFEIVEDEVHVNREIITKTIKIVPYRTITNVEIKQGSYDRLLGLGTIEIQTAGFSNSKIGPEERLDGLPAHKLETIQTLIINRVRKVRGTPGTSHDQDTLEDDHVLVSILNEVQELKRILLNRNK